MSSARSGSTEAMASAYASRGMSDAGESITACNSGTVGDIERILVPLTVDVGRIRRGLRCEEETRAAPVGE